MRPDGVYVAATAQFTPTPTPVPAAVATDSATTRTIASTGLESVCIEPDLAAPQLAARAGAAALGRASCAPEDFALLLHASTSYQGHDLWPAAAYVQRSTLGTHTPAIDVAQMSNGGLAATELAAGYLSGHRATSAMVTTGDCFPEPGWDRWRTDPGTVFADGGTAMVLDTRPGLAAIRSIVTVSDSSLEGMNRGDDRFGPAPRADRAVIDLDRTRRAFVASQGRGSVMNRVEAGAGQAVELALAEADTDIADVDRVILPSLGLARLRAQFLGPLGLHPDRTTWSFGRRTGHLGAGDQIAGLDHLITSQELRPGGRYLLIGVGAGFSWSAAVLEAVAGGPP